MVELKKIPGNTVIETIVSMIILVTMFSLSFLSVISLKKSFNNEIRTNAFIVVNSFINNTNLIEEDVQTIQYSSFELNISAKQYFDKPDLTIFIVSAVTKNNKVVYEAKRIVKDR